MRIRVSRTPLLAALAGAVVLLVPGGGAATADTVADVQPPPLTPAVLAQYRSTLLGVAESSDDPTPTNMEIVATDSQTAEEFISAGTGSSESGGPVLPAYVACEHGTFPTEEPPFSPPANWRQQWGRPSHALCLLQSVPVGDVAVRYYAVDHPDLSTLGPVERLGSVSQPSAAAFARLRRVLLSHARLDGDAHPTRLRAVETMSDAAEWAIPTLPKPNFAIPGIPFPVYLACGEGRFTARRGTTTLCVYLPVRSRQHTATSDTRRYPKLDWIGTPRSL